MIGARSCVAFGGFDFSCAKVDRSCAFSSSVFLASKSPWIDWDRIALRPRVLPRKLDVYYIYIQYIYIFFLETK